MFNRGNQKNIAVRHKKIDHDLFKTFFDLGVDLRLVVSGDLFCLWT